MKVLINNKEYDVEEIYIKTNNGKFGVYEFIEDDELVITKTENWSGDKCEEIILIPRGLNKVALR